MALLANINRDPKQTSAYERADFHPFAEDTQGVAADPGLFVDTLAMILEAV